MDELGELLHRELVHYVHGSAEVVFVRGSLRVHLERGCQDRLRVLVVLVQLLLAPLQELRDVRAARRDAGRDGTLPARAS